MSLIIRGSKYNYESKPHSERFKEAGKNAGKNWRKKMTEYKLSVFIRVDENKVKSENHQPYGTLGYQEEVIAFKLQPTTPQTGLCPSDAENIQENGFCP